MTPPVQTPAFRSRRIAARPFTGPPALLLARTAALSEAARAVLGKLPCTIGDIVPEGATVGELADALVPIAELQVRGFIRFENGCDCGFDPDPCPVHSCHAAGCRELAIVDRGYCGMHVVVGP